MAVPSVYRVLQLSAPGAASNFAVKTVPLRPPRPSEVVVKVAACGIAYRDIVDRTGGFKFIRRPTVLGHEFAGTVCGTNPEAAKSQASSSTAPPVSSTKAKNETSSNPMEWLRPAPRWSVGDRVLSLHWDQTHAWPTPLHSSGAVDSMFGLTTDGGYGEYVTAAAGALVRCPPTWTAPEACSVVSTFGTVWSGAVVRGGLKSGERVLITGASGGLGTSAIQLCTALGCHVTVATTSLEKAAKLRERFPSITDALHFDAAEGRFVAINATTSGAGGATTKAAIPQFDMVIECVGGPTFAAGLRQLCAGGRIVLIGNVGPNPAPPLPLGLCVLKSLSVIGSDSIRADHFETQLVPFMQSHGLKPVVDRRIPLEDIPAAHSALEARQATGRIVAVVSNDF